MAQFIRVRRLNRTPLRLGNTNVTNLAKGTLVNLDDPAVQRDIRFFSWRMEVLPGSTSDSRTIENMPLAVVSTDLTTPLTTQKIRVTPLRLNAGDVVTTFTWKSGGTAASVPTNQWSALFNVVSTNLVALAVTADRTTTAWAGDADKVFTVATPYTVPTSGTYYAGLMVKATTTPTLAGAAATDSTNILSTNGNEATAVRTTPIAAATTIAVADISLDVKVPYVAIA